MARDIGPLMMSMGVDSRGFRSGLSESMKTVQSFSATLNVVGYRMGAAFAASFGAISGFALKVGTDFESAMAGVRKTVDPATTDFAKLESSLMDASKATGIAAAELADLTRIGGQLGVEGTKQLAKFTDTIAKLSIAAAELTPEAAARGLARLVALTGESIDDVDKLASTLAFLGDKLPTTEERILNFSVLLGGMAKAANLSGEQLLGLAGGFSAVVPGTERASTAVQRLVQQMIEATATGGPKLQEFANVTKMSMDEFQQLFQKDAGEAIAQFIEGLGRLKDEGSDKLLVSLEKLDLQNLRTVQTMLAGAGAADLFRKAMDAATKDRERHLKLEREFAVQLSTVSAQFGRLKRAVEEIGINLFNAFKDQILGLIDVGIKFAGALATMAKWIQSLPDPFKVAILGAIGLAGALVALTIAAGTMGGALVGTISLINQSKTVFALLAGELVKLKGVFMATSVAGGQMMLPFDKGTTAANKFSGALSKLVPMVTKLGPAFSSIGSAVGPVAASVGTAAAAIAAGILSGVAAADFLSARAEALQGKSDDLAKNAINNAGIFQKAWYGSIEVFKLLGGAAKDTGGIIIETIKGWIDVAKGWGTTIASTFTAVITWITSFGGSVGGVLGPVIEFGKQILYWGSGIGVLVEGFKLIGPALDGLAILFDGLSDKMTKFFEGWIMSMEKIDPDADPVTAAMRYQAEQLGITIEAGEKGIDVANRLAEAARKEAEEFAASAEGIRQAAEAKINLRMENESIIESLRASAEEAKRLKDAASFLGIKEEELSKIISEQGESFLDAVDAMREKIKADEEAKKAAEALRSEIEALTIDTAVTEFENYQRALIEAFAAGKEFTDQGLDAMSKKLFELAQRAGMEVDPALENLRKKFNENLVASIDWAKGIDQAIKSASKSLKDFSDISDEALQPPAGFKFTGAPEMPSFGETPKDMPGTLGAAIVAETEKQMKEAEKQAKKFRSAVRDLAAAFQVLGIDADSAFGKIMGGLTVGMQVGAEMKSSFKDIQGIMQKEGGSLFSSEGLAAGMQFMGNVVQGAGTIWKATAGGGAKAIFGGAAAGMSMGAQIGGPIGAGIGAAVGAAIGGIRNLWKSESEKIAADIERDFGVKISEELAKAIEATQEKFDLGRFESRLLHLGDIMREAGGAVAFGMENAEKQVVDLLNSIELGTVPAEEGIKAVGDAFSMMAEETFEAGKFADAAMLNIINRARELGQEIPEIAAFISDQLAQAAEGVSKMIGQAMEGEGGEKMFGGIQVATAEDAQAQATIFAAAFFATLQEEGLLAAVDAFEPAFQELKAKLEAFGGEVDFGGVQRFFDIAKDPQFRPLLEGIGGLTEAMTGLGNAGYLTTETFGALQQQAGAAFEQLTAAGLSQEEALQQIAPFLQEALNASQMFGFELDENTQKLIDQAEAAGIGFKTDPMQRMVEVLEIVATKLGATAEELGLVGNAGAQAGQHVAESFGMAGEEIGRDLEFIEGRGREAFERFEQGASENLRQISGTGMNEMQTLSNAGQEAVNALTASFEQGTAKDLEQFQVLHQGVADGTLGIVESMSIAVDAVGALGDSALGSADKFAAMADAARNAAAAASSANQTGGGGPGAPEGGQFGLATTVSVPTPFVAGEAGEERVEITPGGGRGGGDTGGPSIVVLQIDGKTIGKVIGDLSRTGDVRIHSDAVGEFG